MTAIVEACKKIAKNSRFERQFSKAYSYLRYLYHGDIGFSLSTHPEVSIQVPAEWANTDLSGQPEFFGYYDKSPWSPDSSKYLTHRITTDSEVDVVVYDQRNHSSEVIDRTAAWNYQQGAMTQWWSNNEVIFNCVVNNELRAKIIDINDQTSQIVPHPIQTIAPNNSEYLSLNYQRLDQMNAQYGYNLNIQNFCADQDYGEDGLWRVDLTSRDCELIVSLSELRGINPTNQMIEAPNWVNHAMYSPDGHRILFMHRWDTSIGRASRLYTADSDGTNLKLLMDDFLISHYSWRTNSEAIVWGRGPEGDRYYMLNTESGELEPLNAELNEFGDGHPSFSPDNRWIVTDSYPDRAQKRHLLLFDTNSRTRTKLGELQSPISFRGERSCDLHPRWDRSGSLISIDSTHDGVRKNYILDISDIMIDN